MQYLLKLLLIFIIILNLNSCQKKDKEEKKISITTTIFPLYDFIREIGREKVKIKMIIPPGTEVHSYEPTPKDIITINESDLFIYIGEDLEPWAEDILKSLKNKELKVLEVGEKYIHNKEEETEEEDHHHHHQKDPHIWLDFEIAQKIVSDIAKELSKIDNKNKDYYLNNASNYIERLKILDEKYKNTLAKCEIKTILYGGHFAFGYLAKRYGLNHISPYKNFSPNSEPTPKDIAYLIELIKKNKFEYLFYEELIDPKVAKAIASSTGIKLELLHAAHNLTKEELENNVRFLDIMETNLIKLKKGLGYKE